MAIRVKRIYEPVAGDDGWRVLVDRLWPRGITRERASVDEWLKDLAPSHELRQWYEHQERRWPEFRQRYAAEIASTSLPLLEQLIARTRKQDVTLLFSSRELERNNAVALKLLIEAGGV